jgi:hypothetical protein
VWIPQRKSAGHAVKAWAGTDMAWGNLITLDYENNLRIYEAATSARL